MRRRFSSLAATEQIESLLFVTHELQRLEACSYATFPVTKRLAVLRIREAACAVLVGVTVYHMLSPAIAGSRKFCCARSASGSAFRASFRHQNVNSVGIGGCNLSKSRRATRARRVRVTRDFGSRRCLSCCAQTCHSPTKAATAQCCSQL
jgi:hypothetical protein